MRYESLLTRPLAIVARRPWLIALGLLAGEFGEASSNLSIRTNQRRSPLPADLTWLPYWINDRIALLIEIALLSLIVYLLLLCVSCVAAGAIVRGVDVLDSGRPINFGAALRAGLTSFWRVLGLRLVLLLLLVVPALLLIVPPAVGAASGREGLIRGLLIDIPLLTAYIFWLFFVSWVGILALRACVLDGQGPISGLGAGFAILRDQFHRVALTGAIFLGTGLVLGIVTGAVLSAFSGPFAGDLTRELQDGDWSSLLRTGATYLVIIVPVSLVLRALTGSYFSAFWTLAYRRFVLLGPTLGRRSAAIAEPPPLPA